MSNDIYTDALVNQRMLQEEDLKKMVDAYQRFEDIDKYSRVANISENEITEIKINSVKIYRMWLNE
jgi:type I restriction-modification system DNA methylase subunit